MEKIGNRLIGRYNRIEELQKKKSTNSLLIGHYDEKPVLFNPGLGRISKSATAGLFMSQMLYWHQKGRNKEWVYKTIKEFHQETCLTRSEQDRAIKKWEAMEILEVKRKGIPQRRYFRVDIGKLEILLKADHRKRKIESGK